MSFSATESLRFSSVSLACVSSPSLTEELNVRRVQCVPELPNGMNVALVVGYVVGFTAPNAIHNFSFDFVIHDCVSKGDVESGEHLDAQCWNLGNGLLLVGTEDGEALQARMPWVTVDPQRYPIEYLSNGFRVSFEYIPPNSRVSFHFVAAYNPGESDNRAEWFAVDIPHAALFEFPTEKLLHGRRRNSK